MLTPLPATSFDRAYRQYEPTSKKGINVRIVPDGDKNVVRDCNNLLQSKNARCKPTRIIQTYQWHQIRYCRRKVEKSFNVTKKVIHENENNEDIEYEN